jgi:hypothetical protein
MAAPVTAVSVGTRADPTIAEGRALDVPALCPATK